MVGKENDSLVDAIDEGKIVRVSEEYAKREGLPIIRRQATNLQQLSAEKAQFQPLSSREKKGLLKFEEFRRPLKSEEGIVSELKENFHWTLINLRKAKGLSRRQVANSIGASEYDLKMLEHGLLTKEDYSLIDKVEAFYKVSLRKDKRLSGSPLQNALKAKREAELNKLPDLPKDDIQGSISGEDIELEEEF